MTKAFLAAVLLAAVFACADNGGGGGNEADVDAQRQAVNAAAFFLGDVGGAAAPIGESYDCGIALAGATPVPGRCEWTTLVQTSTWLVTFRETWACSQFAQDVEGYPPCTAITGFHEWQYEVNLATNEVISVGETGQYPPDYAQ